MAIAFVRQASGTGATTTSLAVTVTASTAGNFLIAVISNQSGATNPITGVTDNSGSNTWALAIAGWLAGSNTRCEIWYVANAASTTQVTCTTSTGANRSMTVAEFSGLATASPVDQTGISGNASSTSAPGGSVTTTNAADLVIGGLSWAASVTSTLTSGSFTALTGQTTNQRLSAAYQIVASTGTYQTTWTLSSAGTSGAATASFKAAAVAVVPQPPVINNRSAVLFRRPSW